jgi:hypothetical protein
MSDSDIRLYKCKSFTEFIIGDVQQFAYIQNYYFSFLLGTVKVDLWNYLQDTSNLRLPSKRLN